MQPKIKICAVQCEVSPDFDKNMSRMEGSFSRAAKNNCDIICFPEIFLTGPLSRKKYDNEKVLRAKEAFSRLCSNHGMFGVMGSIIENVKGEFYNIGYLFDDGGNVLGNYKKNHLVQKSEAKYLKAGSEVNVFRTKIGSIGMQICRDLLYPEVTRRLMLKKADIVFCPSFWCSESTSYEWVYNHKYFRRRAPREVDSLVSARAIESCMVFVYANAAGISKFGGESGILLGRSQIALPFYGTTDILGSNREGALFASVDLQIVRDAKKVYKIENGMKDYYNNKV